MARGSIADEQNDTIAAAIDAAAAKMETI